MGDSQMTFAENCDSCTTPCPNIHATSLFYSLTADVTDIACQLAAPFPHHDDHLERRLIRTDPFLDDFVPNEYTSALYGDPIFSWRGRERRPPFYDDATKRRRRREVGEESAGTG